MRALGPLILALFAALVAGGGNAAKREVFVLVPKSVVHPYWARVKAGMAEAAERLGVEAVFDGPVNNDLAKQIEIIEGYISRRAAGIAVSPNDPRGVERVIRKAVRRDIPVVTFDSDAPASERFLYIGTVNRLAGRKAGEVLIEQLKGKGTVAILHGSLTALNLRERLEGFREAVDEEEGIKIVALEENRDDAALALSQAENILQKYPELNAFFGTSAPGAPAAVAALRSCGRLGAVKVVGFDLDERNIKAIEKGWITAIVEQRPRLMGYLALEWLVKLSRGEKPPVKVIDTGVEIVTRENVRQAAELL